MARNRIYLCLAHMSGREQAFIKEAFDTNWVVPLGPNVNGFEGDLKDFVTSLSPKECAESAENISSCHDGSGVACMESTGNSAECNCDTNRTCIMPCMEGTENSAECSCDANRTCIMPCMEGTGNSVKCNRQNSEDSTNAIKHSLQNKEVVALSAGTAAVHLALLACGVGAGDEVCVQSFTFCASSHPITYLGATPVFIDSERDTWNMDPELLEQAIRDRMAKTGKKPKAIVPVALYGMPYQVERILEIGDKYNIPVIEDAAEGFGSRYKGRMLGTFGRYGVLSFNGNKMITTSGGGALICSSVEEKEKIMWYATQAREAYPYYQHEAIGYNYRMSNICAGIGRGQMTVAQEHIEHHKHVQALYEELLSGVHGITMMKAPSADYDSNYWLCTMLIDEAVRVKGQERAYGAAITSAVGGAAGVIHASESIHTDCEPNANVEAMRMALDAAGIEARPLWKPMHKQPVYKNAPAYVNGVSEELFKCGMCLPAGPCVSDEDVRYIVQQIKENLYW